MNSIKHCVVALMAACLTAASGASYAEWTPQQTVRIITANAVGGAADINARLLAFGLAKKWNQSVIVVNEAGAAGAAAAVTVARAAPNGLTLLLAFQSLIAVNPILYPKLPFKEDEFAPVILLTKTPHILLVNPKLPATTLQELIALAKATPGSLNFGSGGGGSSQQLAAELLKEAAGIDIAHIPYKGAAPAAAALMANDIQLLFDASTTAIGHIRGGRLRGIAVASLKRLPQLPDLPTFDESGLKGFEAGVGHGILVPSATPPDIVATLNAVINEVIREPAYIKPMTDGGAQVIGGSPAVFRTYLNNERTKWAAIITRQHIQAD
jgi:tripartite-type tricarboxylate transporter receptor subunit TctC